MNVKQTMANAAHAHGYTHNYLFGVYNHGFVYAIWAENISAEDIADLSYVDKPCKEHPERGLCLRFKGSQQDTMRMAVKRRYRIDCIASAAAFDAAKKEWLESHPKRNTGHFFEAYIASLNGLTWRYQQDDGRLAPDLWINGTPWQLKFLGGNFITEAQMLRWA